MSVRVLSILRAKFVLCVGVATCCITAWMGTAFSDTVIIDCSECKDDFDPYCSLGGRCTTNSGICEGTDPGKYYECLKWTAVKKMSCVSSKTHNCAIVTGTTVTAPCAKAEQRILCDVPNDDCGVTADCPVNLTLNMVPCWQNRALRPYQFCP